ncbi:hypothetical protein ACFONG_14725 [Uliginosibacterium paludis]|uniref:Uncharacterized protein n=1 Tax=Uliginosibacterium paludis TaxID=1615952 RepID=A0ABV2CW06_9RHOO
MPPVPSRFHRPDPPGLLALSAALRLSAAMLLIALLWSGVVWALSA